MPNPTKKTFATFKKMTSEKKASLLATVVSIVLIVLGIVGLFLVQFSLDTPQDLRQQASVDQGQVTLTSTFTPPQDTVSDLVVGQVEAIDFFVNTGGVQVDGLQFVFNIITDDFESTPEIVLDPATNLSAAYQEVEQTTDGYLVGLILHDDQFGTFGASQNTRIFSVRFTPKTAGTISFSFDREKSQALVANTNPPEDELTHVETFNYTVVDLSGGTSPSPTVSPTVEPTANPTTNPSVDPTAAPTTEPTTNPTAEPTTSTTTTSTQTQTSTGVGGGNIASCNQSCSSNNDCQANYRCYQNRCRLVTNVSSSSCENPGSQGLQKSCNQTCDNTGECATGLLCYQGSCRNPINATNTSCADATVIVKEQMASSCGQTCTSNNQCATNLTCYQGSCRLATNPSSSSCSPTTQTTVSNTYSQTKGGLSETDTDTEQGSNSASLSTSPSSSASTTPNPSARATAVPLTNITDDDQESAWSALLDNLQDRGSTFPMAMIGSGLFLVLLVLLFFFLRRKRSTLNPPTPQNPQYKQQVDNLQHRINSLQQQPDQPEQPPAPNVLSTPEHTVPTPVPPQNQPASPVPPPLATKPYQPPIKPGPSMVGKLKQRGTRFNPGEQVPPRDQ